MLGNIENHHCINCKDEYPFKYLNGKKCLKSCKDENLYQYKTECYDECLNKTYLDEETFICYDNCNENTNNDNIYIYNNLCVNECPNEYKLNEETNRCEKIIENIPSTIILKEEENYECEKSR